MTGAMPELLPLVTIGLMTPLLAPLVEAAPSSSNKPVRPPHPTKNAAKQRPARMALRTGLRLRDADTKGFRVRHGNGASLLIFRVWSRG
jgi:hypothetical protein